MSPLFLTERSWKPPPSWCCSLSRSAAISPAFCCFFFSHPCRLSKSLDRLGPEVFFWQSKISEVLGGSGYNSDRLSTPYVPQLTGTCWVQEDQGAGNQSPVLHSNGDVKFLCCTWAWCLVCLPSEVPFWGK